MGLKIDPAMIEEQYQREVAWGVPHADIETYLKTCGLVVEIETFLTIEDMSPMPFAENSGDIFTAASEALQKLRNIPNPNPNQLAQLCWLEDDLFQVASVLYLNNIADLKEYLPLISANQMEVLAREVKKLESVTESTDDGQESDALLEACAEQCYPTNDNPKYEVSEEKRRTRLIYFLQHIVHST